MLTKIRKFLWFDITPRRELYAELNQCYEKIKKQNKELFEVENQLYDVRIDRDKFLNEKLDLEREVWELQDKIRYLKGCCNSEHDDETSM